MPKNTQAIVPNIGVILSITSFSLAKNTEVNRKCIDKYDLRKTRFPCDSKVIALDLVSHFPKYIKI